MSLLDMPTPPAIAGAKRIHRLGKPDELDEDNQETTVPRKKKTDPAPAAAQETKPAGKRRGPKPGFKRKKAPITPDVGGKAAFGVYEDGSVVIDAPECKGRLDPELAGRLVAFIQKLQRK